MRGLKNNSPKIYLFTQSHQEIWNTSLPFGMFKYLEREGQQNCFQNFWKKIGNCTVEVRSFQFALLFNF